MKKSREVMLEGWQNLLSLYQDELDELEERSEALQKEVRHIKAEIEKLS